MERNTKGRSMNRNALKPLQDDKPGWAALYCADCGTLDGHMGIPDGMTADEVRKEWDHWQCAPCFRKFAEGVA